MQDRPQTGLDRGSPIVRLAGACCSVILLAALLGACGSGDDEPAPAPPDPREAFEPASGTYKYATTGFEKIDALLGARHAYPATTKVRVIRTACGYNERWSALPERWMRFDYCVDPDGARRIVAITDYHEFLGYPVSLNFRCSGDPIPPLASARRGERWTNRCAGSSTALRIRGRVVGPETIEVEGKPVEAVHLRISSRTTGKATGDNINDSWLARSGGRLVRRTVAGEARTKTPVGKVRSEERFRIRLKSSEPAGLRVAPGES